MPSLVDDVVALLEQIGRPAHVVGHDWGATVAWGVAATRPDLVTGLTALSVPHGGAMKRAMLHSSQALRSSYFGLLNVPMLLEGLAKVRPHLLDPVLHRSGMDDEQVARFHREVVEDGALPYALGWYRGLPLAALPKVVPGLGALADYRDVELEGVSHWIPEEAPGVVAEAVLHRVRGDG